MSEPAATAPLRVVDALQRTADFLRERGVESARLDAELIFAHVLGLSRLEVYLAHDRPLNDEERSRARALVAERGKRVPLPHLLGTRDFHALTLEITPDVFIPSPDTEALVDTLIAHAAQLPDGEIADIGTGSGAIAVSLAHAMADRRFLATDCSAEALAVAGRNADRHGVTNRVRLTEGDLFAGESGPFAAVVSNPPYIAETDRMALPPEVLHQPAVALFGGGDGLDVYRRLIPPAVERLLPGGLLLLEVGAGQAPTVTKMLQAAGLHSVVTRPDLAGIARVVLGQMPGP